MISTTMSHQEEKPLRAALSAGLIAFLLFSQASLAKTLNFPRFKALDSAAKEKLVKRFVRRDAEGYWTVRVSKYEVHTRISAEFALRMAYLMDDFHAKFTRIFKGRFQRRERPKLYVFPDMKTYRAFVTSQRARPGFSAGMYMPQARILVCQRGRGDAVLKKILFHEGTHQLLHAYTGRMRIPVWFNEGVATNFETWDLARSAAENVKRSILVSTRRHLVADALRKDELYPLATLLNQDGRSWSEASDPHLNYAMAWSLVNFLLHNPKNLRLLNTVLMAIRKGRDLKKVLPLAVKRKLEAAWHQDIRTRLKLYNDFVAPVLVLRAKKKFRERRLKHLEKGVSAFPDLPDGRFFRGRLLCEMGRYEAAIEDLAAVEKRDPHFPRLYALLGRAYKEMGLTARARTCLRKAIARRPKDQALKTLMAKLHATAKKPGAPRRAPPQGHF